MIIQGSANTNKDEILIKKYSDLISKGVKPDDILVILLNPFKKNNFIKLLEEKNCSQSKIYTLNGLYYNTFKDNIPFVKELLNYSADDEIYQCGLEVSQYIFKQCIKESDFSDYISKVNLLHQLFRRYSLIVQNALTDEEVKERSKILNETFALDAYNAIKKYKQKTIEYKSFDYLRQTAIFPVLYQKTGYFNNIKYLIVDDADEMPFIFWQFVDYIMPQLKDYAIAYDKNGSSRCGYLCAYKSGIEEFVKKYNPQKLVLDDKSVFFELSEKFFNTIKASKKLLIKDFENNNYFNRLDMLNAVFCSINELILKGIKTDEIAIITPLCDEILYKYAKSNNLGLKFQIISGSEKLSDISGIKHIISVLKIINNIEINDYEIKSLLLNFLNLPYRKCINYIKELKELNFSNSEKSEAYEKLISVINSLRNTKYSLTEQINIIYENLIKGKISSKDIVKYEFLIKEAQNFEQAFSSFGEKTIKDFIIQIENSVVSENPINAFNRENDEIIVSTPQKLIDFGIKTKYQFWLDISNSEWFKQDTGTLYNAWVFNRDWNQNKHSFDDEVVLSKDKTARCVRKLMHLAQNKIIFYSSVYDSRGNENFGGLSDYIILKETKKAEYKIIPRDDQKPVLEYEKGKMGIMAVPGAGKTTILLALIIKLINSGINPENIFVLTYMESAAKNFKERIKASINEGMELPNISTIHGLALRIIKENGNFSKVGLDENFEICDDSEKERIIKELFFKLKISDDNYDNYIRSISTVKLSENQNELNSKYKEIQDFYNFLGEYNKILKSKNLIDYDDMLRFAVKILKNDRETALYYQNLCKFIIEDEAQDSTKIQQTLINILSEKHKNIIRCGDINQSITSTFTNSDLKSFRKFIEENNKVEMVSSQRCAKPIYSLANKMVQEALNDEIKKSAFYNISIIGTDNNPKSDINPSFEFFENEKDEKLFILNKIKEIQKQTQDASIAILLRLNSQVNEYNEYLLQNGIKTQVRTDSLVQKNIYKYIYAVLKVCENPLNNINIKNLALLYAKNDSDKDYINNYFDSINEPFINIDADEIESEILAQIYWDVDYILNNSDKPMDEIALNAGLFYSKNSVDEANTYLITTFIRRLNSDIKTEKEILNSIDYYSKKPMSAYKFFEDTSNTEQNSVRIMTMHKSKGDEFDIVFIPMLTEDNYPVDMSNIKLKSGGHFVESIKHSVDNTKIKTPDELKQEQIEETLRLLYVGVTRARQNLYFSCSNHYLMRKNAKKSAFMQKIIEEKI